MKKIFTLILVASALALTGCSPTRDTAIADSQKSAIESVLAQREKIEKQHIVSFGGERLTALMAIDVRSCPADFRSAWFDYLTEAHELHIRAERVAVIGLAAGKPVSDLPALIMFAAESPGAGEYLLAAVGKVDDAWAKVERSGMNYGVMPTIDVSDMSHRPNTALEPTATAPSVSTNQ